MWMSTTTLILWLVVVLTWSATLATGVLLYLSIGALYASSISATLIVDGDEESAVRLWVFQTVAWLPWLVGTTALEVRNILRD